MPDMPQNVQPAGLLKPHHLTLSKRMAAPPARLYRAWITEIDHWLAAPGSAVMTAAVNGLYFFQTAHGAYCMPYYGRFLQLQLNELIEMAWVSAGTQGLESVLKVEMVPAENGTQLTLTHSGLPNEVHRDEHAAAWPLILAELDRYTQTGGMAP